MRRNPIEVLRRCSVFLDGVRETTQHLNTGERNFRLVEFAHERGGLNTKTRVGLERAGFARQLD